jgi:signal transduction histidine kinase
MTKRREQLTAAVAIVVMIAFAALIVSTVLDAQRRGRRALERQKVEQVEQLAASMDTRLAGAQTAFAGIISLPFTLATGSKADALLLANLQSQQPEARTGFVLLDATGRITNGTLLLDPAVIGTKLRRPGLADALARGGGAILPVAPGLTTPLPTLALMRAIEDKAGHVRGAFLYESDVSTENAFNEEVSKLGGPHTGEVLFLDQRGTVVASSNGDLIGKPIADRRLMREPEGLSRSNDDVVVIADVPEADWRAVFRQKASEFDGGLGRRLQLAVLLIVVVGLLATGTAVIVLVNRLRAAREEQRRLAEINAAREEFISIVSHELRTPVAGVIGFLQTLLDHWDRFTDPERRATVARASVNARRLQTLTRDVLDVSSAEQGTIQYAFGPVDLREEVAAAVEVVRDAQPEREIDVDAPIDGAWVTGDGDRLMQVLLNLLDNAVASSPPASPIDVTMDSVDGEVVVSVVDRGAGLSADERETVFEKFVRGRSAGVRGTGLGLYLCREIVTAHGGRIWVETNEGSGATFRFSLPASDAPAPPPAPAATPHVVTPD